MGKAVSLFVTLAIPGESQHDGCGSTLDRLECDRG